MLLTVEFIKLLYMYRNRRGSKITLFFEWKQDSSEAHLWQKLKHKSEYRPFNSVAVVCNPIHSVYVRLRPPAGAAVLGWRGAAELGGPWRDVATDDMRGCAGRPCAE